MGDDKKDTGGNTSWTETVVGTTTADEIYHSMGDRGKSLNYHDDGKGFTRVDQSDTRHTYRDADNSKGHDHWVDGQKVDRD